MILYRVTAFSGEDWQNMWETTQALGLEKLQECLKANYSEARLDRVEVPTDKEGLCEALNRASAHPMAWDGVTVYRSGDKPRKAPPLPSLGLEPEGRPTQHGDAPRLTSRQEDLLAALREAGGRATRDALVQATGIPNASIGILLRTLGHSGLGLVNQEGYTLELVENTA